MLSLYVNPMKFDIKKGEISIGNENIEWKKQIATVAKKKGLEAVEFLNQKYGPKIGGKVGSIVFGHFDYIEDSTIYLMYSPKPNIKPVELQYDVYIPAGVELVEESHDIESTDEKLIIHGDIFGFCLDNKTLYFKDIDVTQYIEFVQRDNNTPEDELVNSDLDEEYQLESSDDGEENSEDSGESSDDGGDEDIEAELNGADADEEVDDDEDEEDEEDDENEEDEDEDNADDTEQKNGKTVSKSSKSKQNTKGKKTNTSSQKDKAKSNQKKGQICENGDNGEDGEDALEIGDGDDDDEEDDEEIEEQDEPEAEDAEGEVVANLEEATEFVDYDQDADEDKTIIKKKKTKTNKSLKLVGNIDFSILFNILNPEAIDKITPETELHNSRKLNIGILRKLNLPVKTCQLVEKGIYNYAIEKCNSRQVIPIWDNPEFVDIYISKAKNIFTNLNTKCYVGNTKLIEKIKSGSINPYELAFIDTYKLFIDRWNDIIEENVKREKMIRDSIQECASDLFECPRCHKRKTIYVEVQTRSSDEPMTKFITCLECGKRWKKY